MNPDQKIELKSRLAGLTARERKDLTKRAAAERAGAQAADSKQSRWSIEQWELQLLRAQEAPEGMIVAIHRDRCLARFAGEDRWVPPVPNAVPGDRIRFGGAKAELLPRATCLRRGERPIVANVQTCIIVVSVVQPPLHPRLIDRIQVACAQGGLRPLVVVNKADLGVSEEDQRAAAPYEPRFVSTLDSRGIDGVRGEVAGQLCVAVGHSGVGKSSLVNALLGERLAATGVVSSSSSRGRHTTTSSSLYEGNGVSILDTPGVREFVVSFESPAEVAQGFAEILAQSADCAARGCLHLAEPGCAVREAVKAGAIDSQRYSSYTKLLLEAFPTFEGATRDEDSFCCKHCGERIPLDGAGSAHRNHCPHCLHSVHLDIEPGDRQSACRGLMEPIGVWVRKNGEWALIHRCRDCGELSSNRIASDDNEMLLMSYAVRPLSRPPFPLDRLDRGVSP